MKYALIKKGEVIQTQPNKQDGFIEVCNNIHCGMLYDGNEFTPPTIVKTLDNVREERTPLLKLHVDKYTPLWWSVLTTTQKEEVAAYRIALMDITEQNPTDVTWPVPPSF